MSRHPWLALAGLLAALALVMVVWVSIDRRPPESDHANHLERALRCHRNLAEGGSGGFQAIVEESSFYPPLVPCATGVLYFVTPIVPLTAQTVMLASLALALVAIFFLGRRLADAETGLLAAFFFGTAPFVVFSLTNFQLDLPLAAMVALALYVLLRTEGFARPDWSFAFGVVVGLGMLTKPPFAVYVLPPMLWALWSAWRSTDRHQRLRRLALSLFIGALLALPWYGPRLLGLPMQVLNRSFKQAAESGHADPLTATGLLFYPRVFQPQFGLLAGLLCAWGLWAIRKERGTRVYLWLATVAPFTLFSLIQNKNLRYTLPILPAAALVAAMGVRSLSPIWKRRLIWGCVAAGALQVSMAAFALPRSPTIPLFLTPLVAYFPPNPAAWQQDRVLDDLMKASGGKPATVAVVPNYNFFSVSNLRYEALKRRLPFEMTRGWNGPPLGIDYVIVKTGSQGPSHAREKPERLMRVFAEDPYLDTLYPVIGRYALPDGSEAMLRARRVSPVAGVAPAELARRLEETRRTLLADYVRDATGFRVSLEYRPEGILRGEVDRVRLEAEAATVGELSRRDRAPLRVRDTRVTVEGLLINPLRLAETGALEILDAAAMRIESLTITQADLDEFLRGQPAGRRLRVDFLDGWAAVSLKGFPLSARVGVLPGTAGAPFTLKVEGLRVGGVPIPDLLVGWIVRHFDPTLRLRNLPTPVSLAAVRVRPGRLEVRER